MNMGFVLYAQILQKMRKNMSDDTKEEECCKNCFYVHTRKEPAYESLSKTGYYCRRYPPSTIGIIRVSHDGWCGEYHRKTEN
jgi:hypothetical protein